MCYGGHCVPLYYDEATKQKIDRNVEELAENEHIDYVCYYALFCIILKLL